MNSKSPLVFFFSATSFNITQILEKQPNFSTFNGYLTQTQVAKEINTRSTITVLAVANDAISALSGKPTDLIKRVISLHVVLDYYDSDKLQHLSKKTALFTTLFQTKGSATGQLGFLNVSVLKTGEVAFGSAVPTASFSANLVKSVASEPYNISVLQISNVVIPPGIDNVNSSSSSPAHAPAATTPSSSPSKASPPTPATSAPSPSGGASAPSDASAPSNASSPSDAATAPSDASSPSNASSPSDAEAPGPAVGDTPDDPSQSPSSSPSSDTADGPGVAGDSLVDDNAGAPGPAEASSSFGKRVVSCTGLAFLLGFASLAVL